MNISGYYDRQRIAARVEAGDHRAVIGGRWDEIGNLQIEFLIRRGLQPHHRVLDVGCGSLRCGVKLVDYLEPNRYWGVDLNRSLLDAGFERELRPLGLDSKLDRGHLIETDQFDFSAVTEPIDYAIAQSVFTHLPLNHFRHCLLKLRKVMADGGLFFPTFFICPDDAPIDQPFDQGHNTFTTGIADPYHHRASDIEYMAAQCGWEALSVSEWGHPRGQWIATLRLR